MPRFTLAIVFFLAGAFLLAPRTASATSYSPFLQLEVKNGTYDSTTQTTVATTNAFKLYAYLTPIAGQSGSDLAALLNTTYYIAAALTPKVDVGQDLGTFSFNGNVVRPTADMVYGNPPFAPSNSAGGASNDLVRADSYNTYFKEFSFKFKPSGSSTKCNRLGVNCASAYNVATAPSVTGPTDFDGAQNGQMYYMEFEVDTSALNPNYQVNFDLYTTKDVTSGKNREIKYIAAATSDARSRSIAAIPEPGSLLLIGTGVAALAAAQIRKHRAGR